MSTGCPALSAAGLYLISPVFSSIVAPAGASSPSANFVSAGTGTALPSLSVKFGAVIVVCFPTSASASVYFGVYLPESFSVAFTTFSGTLST